MEVDQLKQIVMNALEEIKGLDIVALDTHKLTAMFDYVVVATGDSARQTKALAMNVHERAKEAGGQVVGMEGEQSGDWVLVDLGSIVVHVMLPAVREYYNLEELWGSASARRPRKERPAAGANRPTA
ncbi:MAG: ribosome silencing factor [Betaproteobacteria bacterium]|nr:ribosome silencing factor [Betaproteobacteria bacterium]